MIRKSLTIAILTVATLASAAPSMAQSLEIGRDGVRLVDPRERAREERREERREDRRDRRALRELRERDAVRIARGEGVREVDDVVRTRNTYRVLGADRRGRDIRVDIDRYTGRVLAVR
ncbi:PepSY domain-containing protein [Mangrovicella endophytica]|uniref:PepSY domain-containing protein n=1 Tax=Mangrovicella endophytica TaxID=2066697 RepID=UPI001FE0696E|nr:PepSY domain-containing protein [Mangrovicella endophytica]